MRRALAAAAAAAVLALPSAVRAAPEGSPWGADYFPNVPLVTHEGRTVRFYDDLVKDRFVVINFIFTRCTKVCPLETAKLRRVKALLGDRVGKDIFFYSISIDPKRDTPEVLKAYAEAYRAGPGWLFLTGKREDVELIRAKFGDRTPVEDHSVSLVLGNDPEGQWTTLSAVDDPGFLAMTIEGWMRTDWKSGEPVKSYAEAPRAARATAGEDVYRRKCAACHGGAGGGQLAPDLSGVTRRRDRAWLARWLANPGKLVAAGDPVALEVASGHAMVMPDLGLRAAEIDALIEFLAARDAADEGGGVAEARAAGAR